MRYTLEDIARKAGVHLSTASRAMRNDKLISAETSSKVRELAKKLGYRPNAMARSLANQKAMAIEIVVSTIPSFANPMLVQNLVGVYEIAELNDYDIFIGTSEGTVQDWSTVLRAFQERKADGCLVFIGSDDFVNDPPDKLFSKLLPVVFVNNMVRHQNTGSVNFDNFQGGYLATKRLIELGHKRIAFIGPGKERLTRERIRGYHRALKEAGVKTSQELYVERQYDMTGENGATAMKQLLQRIDFTAVFCSGDWMALGAMEVAKSQGLSIPGDISFIGFDDIHLAAHVTPSISTVKQDGEKAGRIAAKILVDLMKGNAVPDGNLDITIPVELIERESIGPAPR